MGHYTEFHFNSGLKRDTSDEVINILKHMIGLPMEKPPTPGHVFFECSEWVWIFSSDSAYVDAITYKDMEFRNGMYYLSVHSNFKAYYLISRFLDWISPYLAKNNGDFLGYSRYEDAREPTLIYHNDQKS